MNNAKFGLSNIQFSEDGKNWKPLGVATMEMIATESTNEYDFIKDIDKPISIECKKYPKRHGDVLEQYLYYQNHKKKRIRKKYDLLRRLVWK